MLTAITAGMPSSPPVSLGGGTPSILCGSGMLMSFMLCTGATASVCLIVWSTEHQAWFKYPVDAVALDPGVDGGKGIQRYVLAKGSVGLYCAYLRTTGTGVVTVSSEYSNP